jgi:hypothetical protein
MAKRPSLPPKLSRFLSGPQSLGPAEELSDGSWAVAGRDALVVVGPGGVTDSAMWYQVQYARWDAATRELTIVWVDPARPPLTATTVSEDPSGFMAEVSANVTHALVIQKTAVTGSGTRITASVRRREDGRLFSALVADGPLDEAGQSAADALEREVREGVGLD